MPMMPVRLSRTAADAVILSNRAGRQLALAEG
jgi:hypothetical protein